jgi:hypothetical protein
MPALHLPFRQVGQQKLVALSDSRPQAPFPGVEGMHGACHAARQQFRELKDPGIEAAVAPGRVDGCDNDR